MADELFVDQDEVEGTASGVWSRMLAGNRRFAEGKPEHPNRGAEAREALVDTHAPEAAILSCSDARVSPDIIFDSGLGDLFTVRTAGIRRRSHSDWRSGIRWCGRVPRHAPRCLPRHARGRVSRLRP